MHAANADPAVGYYITFLLYSMVLLAGTSPHVLLPLSDVEKKKTAVKFCGSLVYMIFRCFRRK